MGQARGFRGIPPCEVCQKRRGNQYFPLTVSLFNKGTQQEKYDTYCAQVAREPLLFHRYVVAKLQHCNVNPLQLSACHDLLQSVTFIHSLARSPIVLPVLINSLARSPLVFPQCLAAVHSNLLSGCESKDARDPKPQNVILPLPYWDGSPPLGSARLTSLESSAFKRRNRTGHSQPPVMLDCAMPRLTNRLLRKWLGVSLHYALWKRPGVSLHGSGWASLVRAKSSEVYFVSGDVR